MPPVSSNADNFKKIGSTPPSVARGLKRLYPLSFRRTNLGWQVQVHWPRLAISSVVILVCGWMGLASAAYLFVKYQRGFTEVRFSDMLMLPMRWP